MSYNLIIINIKVSKKYNVRNYISRSILFTFFINKLIKLCSFII